MKDVRMVRALLRILVFVLTAGLSSNSFPGPPSGNSTGFHGFDFEYGQWRVHHRVKSAGEGTWKEFDGTCATRPFMAGQGDIEEHIFSRPTGVTYGTAIRAFDSKTEEWAIWWIDSRYPHLPLDPPVKGRFENGVGSFFSDNTVNGKVVRTRFIWSQITRSSARWEQASSEDGGKSWVRTGSWSFAESATRSHDDSFIEAAAGGGDGCSL